MAWTSPTTSPSDIAGPVVALAEGFRRTTDTNLSHGLEPVEINAHPVGVSGGRGDEPLPSWCALSRSLPKLGWRASQC